MPGSAIPADSLDLLRSRLRGRVVVPEDPDWAEASASWCFWPQSPLAVVVADGVADVVATVQWARDEGVAVAPQPGGHSATGSADGAVLLRTGALKLLTIDADVRLARVGAGVKWGELLAELDGTGLVGLAGSNPDVSVVGYLLGGGLSWFARAHGYAAHALRAVEVVDAQGRLRWVSDDNDPELMWALRGGGGDLVVVTQAEIELQPTTGLYGGKLVFGVADAPAVLRAFVDVARTAPRALTMWAAIAHFPDVDMVPEPLRGQSVVGVDATYLGPAEDGAALLAPVRAAGHLLEDTTGPLEISHLGDVAAEPTDPTPFLDWSSYLTDVTADTIDRLIAATGDRTRTAISIVQLRHVGGALADPPAPRPAVVERAASPFLLELVGIPMSPEAMDPIRASLREAQEALRPELASDLMPLNFLGAGDPMARAFDTATLERLRALKRSVDPAGTIRGHYPLLAQG